MQGILLLDDAADVQRIYIQVTANHYICRSEITKA